MSETKVQPTHLRRAAVVYVRQSTVAQVEQNRESTRRQYDLAERARQFGWCADQITVLDEDLGLSGATTQGRGGFARMTAQVALGHVGILLGCTAPGFLDTRLGYAAWRSSYSSRASSGVR